MLSMSRTESMVRRCLSSAGCAFWQASAYACERFFHAFSSFFVVGTYSGRSYPKYLGLQVSAGTLEPTPRGSQPIQSYAFPAFFGTYWPSTERSRPDAPGPPGLTSMTPWKWAADVV